LAKRAGCRRALALINNATYVPLVRSLGIDAFIDPKATTVSTILQHIRRGKIRGLHSVHEGQGEVVEAEALQTSPLVGRPIRECRIPDGIMFGAIVRDNKVVRPGGDTVIEVGDRVILFARADMVKKVEQLFRVGLEYF
jgi:trk system potassium uptake protein TrkA